MFFFPKTRPSSGVPELFLSEEVDSINTEISAAMKMAPAERDQTDVPRLWKRVILGRGVVNALATLSDNRCAFCEGAGVRLNPYRFRPPGLAEPIKDAEGKYSYLWLSFSWPNFYPICEDCRPDRPNEFPVSGNRASFDKLALTGGGMHAEPPPEDNTLYEPGQIDRPHLRVAALIDGTLMPLNARAEATIAHFKLNGARTTERRRNAIDDLIKLLLDGDRIQNLRGSAFGGAKYLMLRRLCEPLTNIYGGRNRLGADKITGLVTSWQDRHTDFRRQLSSQIEAVQRGDGTSLVIGAAEPTSTLFSPRRLVGVSIKTFKSLEDISFELPATLPETARQRFADQSDSEAPRAPCRLFLGENATGKSSILEAITLTCLDEEDREALELTPRELTLNPEYMGKDAENAALAASTITLRFSDNTSRTLKVDARSGKNGAFRVAGDPRRPLVFAYGAHRLYGKRRRARSLRHIETLFHDDRLLIDPEPFLIRLERENPSALNEVVSALRHIIQIDGSFESIHIDRTSDPSNASCVIRLRRTNPDGSDYILPQRLKVVSSGYRAILALVCDVFEGLLAAHDGDAMAARSAAAIVLIDEIEAHLHPRWKINVIAGLRRALPGVTFLITTHDPLCIRGMLDGEVVALNRYQNQAKEGLGMPERVEPVLGLENIERLTVEQLLTSDLFQLLSTDDRAVDTQLAEVAGILARQRNGGRLSPPELDTLKVFNQQISGALPYGRDVIPQLVQEAVAEYLAHRRQAGKKEASAARQKAKAELKRFLEGLST